MDIKITSLKKAYGDRVVLEGLTHTFAEGQTHVLMGPSGCGKTTLLRLIAGLETPEEGEITGVPKKVAFVFQENRLCEGMDGADNLRLVKRCKREEALRELEQLGLSDIAGQPVSEYSGGMKRRLEIARASFSESSLILLDEPFTGLDEDTLDRVASYCRKAFEGKTVILVTHLLRDAELLQAKPLAMREKGLLFME